MAYLNYNSLLLDMAQGNVNLSTDTFFMMLVTSSYTPDKKTHKRRSDITNEVSGPGYTAGGIAITVTPTADDANDRLVITFGSPSWPVATITSPAGVIYKRRGGAASADELVAYADFGGNITSTGGTFAVSAPTPLYITNP